jgi:zinc transport system substrate-binding protein
MIERRFGNWTTWVVVAALVGGGCHDSREQSTADTGGVKETDSPTANAPIAVTNSYLEAAIRDVLCGDVPLLRLAGPSMCPGHFDMRPSQISDLAHCRLLVRFDFQQSLDEKLRGRNGGSLKTLPIALSGGMCVPETYLAACRQVADHFVSVGEMERKTADGRMAAIAERMTTLTNETHKKIDAAKMHNTPVLSSGHQAMFCQWLGLQTVATFSAGDTASTGEIDQAVRAGEVAGVRIVIANEPEGRRLADALANRLHARVVVFANFPEPNKELAFDNMVRGNLAVLPEMDRSGEKEP